MSNHFISLESVELLSELIRLKKEDINGTIEDGEELTGFVGVTVKKKEKNDCGMMRTSLL